MSEIMKIIDERETQKKKTKTEKNKGDKSYSERVRAKWFCCAFKLGFLQLICKASLIFKSNLELALSKKVHRMIETHLLKNVIFLKTIVSYVLSRKIINV